MTVNKKTKQQRVALQNRDENKNTRQRPDDHSKADGSLSKLPKKDAFANEDGEFGETWKKEYN